MSPRAISSLMLLIALFALIFAAFRSVEGFVLLAMVVSIFSVVFLRQFGCPGVLGAILGSVATYFRCGICMLLVPSPHAGPSLFDRYDLGLAFLSYTIIGTLHGIVAGLGVMYVISLRNALAAEPKKTRRSPR